MIAEYNIPIENLKEGDRDTRGNVITDKPTSWSRGGDGPTVWTYTVRTPSGESREVSTTSKTIVIQSGA